MLLLSSDPCPSSQRRSPKPPNSYTVSPHYSNTPESPPKYTSRSEPQADKAMINIVAIGQAAYDMERRHNEFHREEVYKKS